MHPTTSVVISVQCQFCVVFGREEKVGAKRKAMNHAKFFKTPFCAEHYRQHHEGQHRSRWEEYKSLDDEKRFNYFKNNKNLVKETLRGYFGGSQVSYIVDIDANNVDVIIVTLKNPQKYYYIVDYLVVGCSSRQCTEIYITTRERSGITYMESLNQATVSKYARVGCTMF